MLGTLTLRSEVCDLLITDIRMPGLSGLAIAEALRQGFTRGTSGTEPFAAVVLENGAVLHVPARRETQVLCLPVSEILVRALERRGVQPLIRGHAIVATRRPHEVVVLECIRDLDLELQITFNGQAVMVLPSGVNKGCGRRFASWTCRSTRR